MPSFAGNHTAPSTAYLAQSFSGTAIDGDMEGGGSIADGAGDGGRLECPLLRQKYEFGDMHLQLS